MVASVVGGAAPGDSYYRQAVRDVEERRARRPLRASGTVPTIAWRLVLSCLNPTRPGLPYLHASIHASTARNAAVLDKLATLVEDMKETPTSFGIKCVMSHFSVVE